MNHKALMLAALPLIGTAATPEEKPNIILIITDQHRFDYIGAVNPQIITPNIDNICDDGYIFKNGYSSTPSSTPARASLLTGLSPWHHGLLGYSAKIAEKYPYEMPRMLSNAGYHTAAVGKMHWTPQRNMYGLDELYVDESGRVESEGFESDYRTWFRSVAPDLNPDSLGIGWNEHRAGIYPLSDTLHPTYWTAKKSIEVIDSHSKDQPLFLKVSFARPHSPYDPPAKYYDLYKDRAIDAPWIGDWCGDFGKYEHTPDAAYADYGTEYAVNSRKHYAASVTFIDEQVGRVVAKLKEEGLYDNSIIIFTSDHGDMLGDHHHWRKTYPYEGSSHVPFIVKLPKGMKAKIKPGNIIEAVAELRDILPTFLNVAEVSIPKDMDGGSLLVPIVEGKKGVWREYVDLEHAQCYGSNTAWIGLTDGKMKYVWNYQAATEELYDLQKDPHEIHNIVNENSEAAKLWRDRMKAHLAERGDSFVKDGELQQRQNMLKSPFFPVK